MTKNNVIDLPEDYALVLQQVKKHGEEDFANLEESLKVSKSRLQHIVGALQRKGLISISRSVYDGVMISLSKKGQKLTNYIWPEVMSHANAY